MPLVTGFAGVFDADDLNAAAQDSSVPTISIGSFSATQTAAANRALLKKARKNAHSAILFDGANDNYDFGDIFDLDTNSATFFLVAKWNNGNPFGKNIAASALRYGLIYNGDTTHIGGLFQNNTQVVVADSALTPSDTDFHLYELHVNRTSGKLRVFRDLILLTEQSFTPDPTFSHNSTLPFAVGVLNPNQGLNFFNGEIAYLVPYLRPGEFSAAELLQNRDFIGERFAIAGLLLPAASFSKSQSSGVTPLTVNFTDTSTHNPTSWLWNFGDGTTSNLQNPSRVFASAGTFTVTLTVTNPYGSSSTSQTVTVIAPPPIPVSIWSRMNVVPLAALEAWNALDTATGGGEVGDFSGKQRVLTAGANPPQLEQNRINGYPGIYFDGTKNPLTYSGNLTLRHIFIVASFADATFPNYAGLLSDLSGLGILVGNPLEARFFNINYSALGSYSYRKNYVSFAESAQAAPVSGNAGIIEISYAPGFNMNGIQIGQDRADTTRRWKGHFYESLMYSSVKTAQERRRIYSYLAMKFHLWRQAASGLYMFPFPNNYKTPGQTFTTNLESTSISGAYKGRSKSGLMRSFDVPFTVRQQEEWDAAEAFWMQARNSCVLDDCSFYPSRQFTGRITTPIERDPQSLNNMGYKFGFVTKVGFSASFTETTEVIGGGAP